LIEIGHERGGSYFTRRLAAAFGSMAALLFFVWLIRGYLSISSYSLDLLLSSFTLIVLGRLLRTRTRSGVGRAISSFFGNIAISLILILVGIWFLQWVAAVQKIDTFPSVVSNAVPLLVIVTIATGLLAYAIREISPRRGTLHAARPVMLVRANSEVKAGKTTLTSKSDSVGLPMARYGKTVGCVLFGDVRATFDTPMGSVAATFAGPVTSFGIPFRGEKASRDDQAKLAGQDVDKLIRDAQIDPTASKPFPSAHNVDLPFIHVRDDWFGQSVDVGPISVRKGPDGESVRIGDFEFASDGEQSHSHSWFAKGSQESSFLSLSEEGVSARWNGSSLWMKGDSMRLTAGADGFNYSPSEIRTFSPLHTLQVGNKKMSLNTRKFTLNVTDGKVVLRSESGSKSTESPDLAQDLRSLFTEEAKKHVQDVMNGAPIDIDEMLSSTEEALKKYD